MFYDVRKERKRSRFMGLKVMIWVFPKIGVYTPKWMVYNGNPIQMDDLGGTTIFGNIHLCMMLVVQKKSLIGSMFHGSQEGRLPPTGHAS